MHDMIVLNTFEHSVNSGVVSVGLIAMTRAVFANVLKTYDDQGDTAVCATDGTYTLHFGGWVLVDCGIIDAAFDGAIFVRQFRGVPL